MGTLFQQHLFEIIFFGAAVAACLVLAHILKNTPEKIGLQKPVHKKYFLLCLLPLVPFVLIVVRGHVEGLSYPTGITIHDQVVILSGTIEIVRERPEDQVPFSEYHKKVYLYDGLTGKEIANFPEVTPQYARNGKLLAAGPMGYYIIELATGKVIEIISENKLRDQLQVVSKQKIFSLELDNAKACFMVRTVLDKRFTYDPITDKIDVGDAVARSSYTRPDVKLPAVNLFQPEVIAFSKNGELLLVLSYEDLQKESFLISAVTDTGKLLWTIRDEDISSKLAGEAFAYSDFENNAVADGEHLYFVNAHHLVCLKLTTGQLMWIVSI